MQLGAPPAVEWLHSAARLRALGFPQITHLTPEAANDRYFKGRTDNLEAWSGEQMMWAVV